MQVSRLSNMSFDLLPIWLQTLVMIDSESRQIQNHGDHLHAFVRHHLKWLCCFIGI